MQHNVMVPIYNNYTPCMYTSSLELSPNTDGFFATDFEPAFLLDIINPYCFPFEPKNDDIMPLDDDGAALVRFKWSGGALLLENKHGFRYSDRERRERHGRSSQAPVLGGRGTMGGESEDVSSPSSRDKQSEKRVECGS